MKPYTLFMPLCVLVACASISGTQSFEAERQFTLPGVAAVAGDTGSHTLTAVGVADELSFAKSVLDEVDQLRERDHIDSAEVQLRVVSVQLATDTTFAGITAIRVQLVTAAETIELCARTLSADEQRASSIDCSADHVVDEATLQQSTASSAPAQIGAQLEVSGAMTATKLDSSVTFEIELNVDASL
ncbi:MAG TPA: hypothetical protein VJV78_44925 [Polyangiales bacterium]|nr:hypothetical protein [Polyangiales bacterium]